MKFADSKILQIYNTNLEVVYSNLDSNTFLPYTSLWTDKFQACLRIRNKMKMAGMRFYVCLYNSSIKAFYHFHSKRYTYTPTPTHKCLGCKRNFKLSLVTGRISTRSTTKSAVL